MLPEEKARKILVSSQTPHKISLKTSSRLLVCGQILGLLYGAPHRVLCTGMSRRAKELLRRNEAQTHYAQDGVQA